MDSRKREHLIEQLSAYLDGELTSAEKREVENFLAQDAQARALLSELQTTSRLLHDLPRAKASERVMEGVRTRLERQALLGDTPAGAEPIAREKRFRLRWVAAAAVIGLTFLTFYTLGPLSRPDHPKLIVASADKRRGEAVAPEDRKASSEVTAGRERATEAPATPGVAGEFKSAAKSDGSARDNMDLFGKKASPEPAKSPAFAEGTTPAAPPVAMAVNAAKEQQKDLPALAKAGKREEGERHDAAVLPPAQQMVESKPTVGADEAPVIVLVELSAPDRLAQQKTVDTLKNQGFHASDDVTMGDEQLKRSIDSARRGNQLEDVTGGAVPGSASAGQTNSLSEKSVDAAARKQSMRLLTNQYGRPLTLRLAMPDGAIPETLQQVQSQFPLARVKVMQNQSRYSNAIANNNYANAPSRPAQEQLALRYSGGQQPSEARAGGGPGQQGQFYAKGGAVGSASNMKQNEFYESFGVQSRTQKMLNQAEPRGALASNQAALETSRQSPEGPTSQPALKPKVDLGAGAGGQLVVTDALSPASVPESETLSASSSPAPQQQQGVILVYVDVAETPVPAAAATSQPDAAQNVEVASPEVKPAASQP